MNAERLLEHYEKIADAPNAILRLRRFVLDLAVRGKLVPQDPNDESASELLKRTAAEKVRLVKAGKIKADKPLPPIDEHVGFDVPPNWRWTRLGFVTSYIQRGKSPKYAASDGAPVVSQKCVQWTGLDLTVAKQITLESLADYEPIRFLHDGDLLWNSTGTGTIGRVIRLVQPPEKLVCDSHVTVVRCLEVDPEYIRTWLRSDQVYAFIEDRAAGSTNQVELTAQMATNQVVPLPPLPEQRRIVAKVDELMALCDRLEAARAEREATRNSLTAASLARLNAPHPETFRDDARFALDALWALTARVDQIKQLRQTILNLAIRGELAPQDPSDESALELLKRIAAERATKAKAANVRTKRLISIADEEAGEKLPNGWGIEAIGNLVDPTAAISYGVLVPGPDVEDGVPFVRAQDLSLTGHAPRPNKTISSEIEAQYARTRLKGGEILLCVVGSIGKLGIAPASWAGANIARAVARIAPVDAISSEYLLLAMRSDKIQDYFTEATRTLAQPTLNVGLIEVLPVPLPPLAEQRRIVAKVEELMASCDRLEASLAAAAETRRLLFEALLAEALAPEEEECEREAAE
jgi:type I restriction enzyme, S subunit